jgi:hypothetical protein
MSVDAIADIGLGDILGSAGDLGSMVTDLGTEFLDVSSFTSFEIPSFDVASLGGFEAVGSFAGDASWFDTFNTGDILGGASPVEGLTRSLSDIPSLGSIIDNVPSVSDFNLSSITDSLPSLSSIKDIASTVQSDLGGFVKGAQEAFATYQKVAPLVDLAFNAFGFQNPVNTILAPVSQVVGIAGAAAGVAGAVSTGNVISLATNPAVIGAVYSVAGSAVSPLAQSISTGVTLYNAADAIGSGPVDVRSLATNPAVIGAVYSVAGSSAVPLVQTIGTGVSLYNTANAIGTTINSVTQPGSVVATNGIIGGTFRQLTDAETAALERNISPEYINRLVDPGTSPPLTYNAALVSRDELNLTINSYNTEIANSERAIQSNNANIAAIEAELRDETLPDDRRLVLEEVLQANYENNAIQQNTIALNRDGLSTAVTSLAADQAIIDSTNATVNRSPATVTTSAERDAALAALTAAGGIPSVSSIIQSPANVAVTPGATFNDFVPTVTDPGTGVGVQARNLVQQARDQQALRNLTNTKAQASDWRVRLRLAPNSNYLYNDPVPGLLEPLSAKTGTDGVVFPYTPSIDTAYKANYEPYDLTHSNYRGYFYKNSFVDAVNIRAQFTAQDTTEANYLLAVIHFFRSATKMFYGQDAQRGSPPPMVFLSGLGDFQFNEHPCVISQFNYQLPSDVDYIRAQNALDNGTNFLANRVRTSIPGNPLSFGINRLLNNALTPGALDTRPTQGNLQITTPTYVPTKMEMSISLLPIQSRQQVSKQFSLQAFANGNLLKGGFW